MKKSKKLIFEIYLRENYLITYHPKCQLTIVKHMLLFQKATIVNLNTDSDRRGEFDYDLANIPICLVEH